jgi:hypothetical protein
MALECNEPFVGFVGPAQAEFLGTGRLGLFDRSPEEKWHRAESFVPCVETAILEDNIFSKS